MMSSDLPEAIMRALRWSSFFHGRTVYVKRDGRAMARSCWTISVHKPDRDGYLVIRSGAGLAGIRRRAWRVPRRAEIEERGSA